MFTENRSYIFTGILILAGGVIAYILLRPLPPESQPSADRSGVRDTVEHSLDTMDEDRPLPPGTVRVRLTVTQIERSGDRVFMTANVDSVLGYGSATGTVAVGEVIGIDASYYVASDERELPEVEGDWPVSAIVKQQTTSGFGEQATARWELVEIGGQPDE